MISSEKALALVLSHSSKGFRTREISLSDALDYVLAADVISLIDMPPFRQSAMDGYALKIGETNSYKILGEVQAGGVNSLQLNKGEAVRIFTGAPVPDTADAVVIQEKVRLKADTILVEDPLQLMMNIRPQGEQIKKAAVALAKGTSIKGTHIGFLAGLGITRIEVAEKPAIAVVVTGNELVPAGQDLAHGKIYESNSAMLIAVLKELGYSNTTVISIKDHFESTKEALRETIEKNDVVIVTGGVSVGDYDFVGKALNAIGVHEIFHKVNQKPGKPMYFGKKEHTAIFGLPGNPAAALTCFYVYVYPLLKKYQGAEDAHLLTILLPLLNDYTVIGGDRAQFLKAKISGTGVEILTGQSSAMLSAFGTANAFVFVPEDRIKLEKGEIVKTILLPIK
ncbi:gephyrin-like molybdotransferase Glp [Cellulophaga sp. Hel_I_12]|uniref:molybdopterin molybdotransferase MoeA n=1 Tax=Cellulophaga sp. Hel_I_12 TaxID=1249972 RepID=UPI000648E0D2|nr:gephyrin-like molybdotransferase Glp [Cellulophaga sp. Hel_I_12]